MNISTDVPFSTKLFGTIGTLAIIVGGMVSAFSAHEPTQLAVWASAYLVLVIGVAQVMLAATLPKLAGVTSNRLSVLALSSYNVGGLAVLFGTLIITIWLVNVGGIILAIALLLALYAVRAASKSWLLVMFYLVVGTLLVSIPIGLLLATR